MGAVHVSGRRHLNSLFLLGISLTFVLVLHCHRFQTKEQKGYRRLGFRVLARLCTAAHHHSVWLLPPASLAIAALLFPYTTELVSGYLRR
jgi:hypothetical protein